MKSHVTIGLFWHGFNSGNLGVSALTDANMMMIMEAAPEISIEFVIFGVDGTGGFQPPDELANIRHVKVSSVGQVGQVISAIRTCDLIYDIGSGDSFADIYGWKRLTKIAGLKFLSALTGRRPVLSPQTIGPFTTWPSKIVGKLAIQSCDAVFARDKLSLDRAKALIGNKSIPVLESASDVAFGLKCLTGWPEQFPDLEQGVKHIGFNVSGLLYNGGYSGNNQFGLSLDYKNLVRDLLDQLSVLEKTQVWLIPHVFNIDHFTQECDRAVSIALEKDFPEVRIAPVFWNARDAKTFIGAMDLMLAARMHAAIAAVSSGIACIPMSYSVKFQGLFESIDYPFTLDLKSLSTEDAKVRVFELMKDTESMSERARAAQQLAVEAMRPYRDRLRADIAQVSETR